MLYVLEAEGMLGVDLLPELFGIVLLRSTDEELDGGKSIGRPDHFLSNSKYLQIDKQIRTALNNQQYY